jgi:UDPglucose 6-dehydrogenase
MKVSIIGTGYVGLVSGVCLASKGHDVTCYDNNHEIVDSLNNGVPTIYETDLKQMLTNVLKEKRFAAKLISNETYFDSELVIIAVGTPSDRGEIDLVYIKQVSILLANYIKSNENFVAVVVKSTVIPGTTDTVIRGIIEENSGKTLGQFGLGMNPEFLREGSAIDDFMRPDRVVIGHDDEKTLKLMEKLYEPWDCDKIFVNTRTAEMIKYVNNSLLAIQISAANEFANIAASIGGIDIMDVMNGVFTDKRWSPILNDNSRISPGILSYLIPGSGFGGSCFPKDVQALRTKAYEVGIKPKILDAVLNVNENQPYQIIKLLKKTLFTLDNKKILLLGLAFKPGTDDIRESVSLKLIDYLLKDKAKIFAHDPIAIENSNKVVNNHINLKFITNWEEKIATVDAIIVATTWTEYKKLASTDLQNVLVGKVLFDVRRFFIPSNFPKSVYLTIGRSIDF